MAERDRRDGGSENNRYDDNNPFMKAANSALMLFMSRLSVPIILGLSVWILSNVSDMKGDMGIVKTQIGIFDKRITDLENWRNSYGGYVPLPAAPIPVPSIPPRR